MHGIAAAVVLGFAALLAARAQDVPSCVASCIASASQAAGCNNSSDWKCMCGTTSFRNTADRCFTASCSNPDEAQIGENTVNVQCSGHATTTIRPPFSPPASTSLTVTNSETSPPQEPSRPPRPTNSLAPPTPPPASPGPGTATSPEPISTVTQVTGTGTGTSPGSPSSPPSLTSSGAGISPTLATGPSEALQPDATATQEGNGAVRVDGVHDQALRALLGGVAMWVLL